MRIETKLISDLKPERINLVSWDSPVHAVQLLTPSGVESGIFGIVAETNQGQRVVGQYKKEGSLLSNLEAIEKTRAALSALGLKWTEKIDTFKGGAVMEAVFTITNYSLGNVGHSAALPEIVLWNSYDGSRKVLGAFRVKLLVCLNGLETMSSVACLQAKHSPNLNLSFMQDRLADVMRNGVNSLTALEGLMKISIPGEEGALRVFSNLVSASAKIKGGGVSSRAAAYMLNAYCAPDENEAALEHSLWRAYMAGTRAMRDLEAVRPTQALTANRALGQVMHLAANPGVSSWAKGVAGMLIDIPAVSLIK